MGTTIMEKTKTGLVKKYHTLAGKAGLDDMAKEAILASFGVDSSKDLSVDQLIEVCDYLNAFVNPKEMALDKARKRLMAAVGGWLSAMGKQQNEAIIKGIIARASKSELNRLSEQKLNSLYNSFNKATKDIKNVKAMTVHEIKLQTRLN